MAVPPVFHGVQISVNGSSNGGTTGGDLNVTLTPSTQFDNTSISNSTTSSLFTVDATNAVGTVTYQWIVTSGAGATINTPTSQTSSVTLSTPYAGLYEGSFRVNVTDERGYTGWVSGTFVVFRQTTGGGVIP